MKKALVVVSFGTSVMETRKKTIDLLEETLQGAFPDRKVYRAWSSRMIRIKMEEAGYPVESLTEVLLRMCRDGVEDVLIQPTYFSAAKEYEEMVDEAERYAGDFSRMFIGRALVSQKEDIRQLADLLERLFGWVRDNELLVFMGHGSDHPAANVYGMLGDMLREKGVGNKMVATIGGSPSLEEILPDIRKRDPIKIYLSPLMVTAGKHIREEMRGNHPNAWEYRLCKEGYEVECIEKGMAEYKEIREVYVQHAKEARKIPKKY